jgi:hypothetical protein
MDGFQKRIDTGERRKVKMAIVRSGQTDNGIEFAQCSCGAPFKQRRKKAREDSIQRHLDRKHGGQGLWL